jgi:hypothetical protein
MPTSNHELRIVQRERRRISVVIQPLHLGQRFSVAGAVELQQVLGLPLELVQIIVRWARGARGTAES